MTDYKHTWRVVDSANVILYVHGDQMELSEGSLLFWQLDEAANVGNLLMIFAPGSWQSASIVNQTTGQPDCFEMIGLAG